jgi:gliding motility-associated-like protein
MLNMKYVTQGIKPNITFSIETETGQVLQTYNSGDLPVEQTVKWKQYGFYFTTPSNASNIVLRMTNNAPGGDGNDLAMDDITFRPCGQLITSAVVGSTSDTIDVCEGNNSSYTFNATVSSGYLLPVYQWQLSTDRGGSWTDIAGATGITYQRQPTGVGKYWYRFTVVEANNAGSTTCRIASNAVVINVHAKPIVNAGAGVNVIPGYAVVLNGMAEGENISYLWTPGNYIDNITTLTPTVTPVQDITYTLTARSMYGCSNTDTVQVKVAAGLYIPSAFTPDGDGKNDTWKIPFLDPAYNATVDVFNRYGQLVYHTSGAIVSWDGKYNGVQQPSGSYIYLITFKINNLKIKGTVTLIR